MAADALKGAELVLDIADRARRCGGIAPSLLYHHCVQAFTRGEIGFDRVTPLYRHAMIHAGMIKPKGSLRFERCPECDAELDIPALDN